MLDSPRAGTLAPSGTDENSLEKTKKKKKKRKRKKNLICKKQDKLNSGLLTRILTKKIAENVKLQHSIGKSYGDSMARIQAACINVLLVNKVVTSTAS